VVKSDVAQWSLFNKGRDLFTTPGVEDYDRWMARKLQSLLKGKKTVVDYGAGDGIWSEYLSRNNPTRRFIAVEWNKDLYEYAITVRKPGLDNLEVVQADMSEPEGIFACDFFFCFGGLEHFSEHAKVLKAWVDRLSLDGKCIVTVPNLLNREFLKNRCGINPEDVLGEERVVTASYGYEELWAPNHLAKVVMDSGLELMELGILEALHYDRPLYFVGLKRVKEAPT